MRNVGKRGIGDKMEIALKEKDFEFMKVLKRKEASLGNIREELGIKKSQTQKIFNNLNKRGMINSRKEGRERLVKLNNNGIYFLNFYLRQLQLQLREMNENE